jgi:hypothetical protein
MLQLGSRRARRRWIVPALVALAVLLVAALVVTDFGHAEYERERRARRAAAGETQLA